MEPIKVNQGNHVWTIESSEDGYYVWYCFGGMQDKETGTAKTIRDAMELILKDMKVVA